MKTTNLSPALAVTGRKGSLFQRVSRIAQNTNLAKKHTVSPKLTAAMIVIMGLLLLATKTEATTFLDSLVEPFENQENSNNLKDNELALNDTTKKIVRVQKTVTVHFDSLLNDDTTIVITTIVNKNGKIDTMRNIANQSNMPFFYEFSEKNLTKEFLLNSAGDTLNKKFLFIRTSPTDSLMKSKSKVMKEQIHYIIKDSLKHKVEVTVVSQDSLSNKIQVFVKKDGQGMIIGDKNYTVANRLELNANSPLYVIDGEEVPQSKASKKILETLNPKDIASIEVFKGEKAIKKYGEQGKNGVIVIKTKKGKKKKSDTSEEINISKDEGSPQPQNFSLQMPGSPIYLKDNHFLFVVDGKVIEKEKVKTINPNDIQSMNVLKGEEAISIYGNKGKDGVILITTKEGSAKTAKIGVIKSTTEIISDGEAEVRIYPNPAQNYVSIGFMFEKETQVWVDVRNTLGQKVATIIDGTYLNKSSMYVWDTAKIPAGTYIITVKRGSKISQHKLILD